MELSGLAQGTECREMLLNDRISQCRNSYLAYPPFTLPARPADSYPVRGVC